MVEKKRVRAPAKIVWGLRFKNYCAGCDKKIPSDRMMCEKCKKEMEVM